MGRSVEHLLLRLLTPAILLFLFAHAVSPALDRAMPARGGHDAPVAAAPYLQDGSSAAKAARPGKAQLRKGRFYEVRPLASAKAGSGDDTAALAANLNEHRPVRRVAFGSRDAGPWRSVADRRAQKPRDSPRVA